MGVRAYERTCMYVVGGLSVSEAAVSLPGAVSHHAVDPPGSFRCPSGFIILLSG